MDYTKAKNTATQWPGMEIGWGVEHCPLCAQEMTLQGHMVGINPGRTRRIEAKKFYCHQCQTPYKSLIESTR